ncbi:YggS family pyridoxal phosphate-dependent enzyme [Patescibacteria group bacterium]|nr:YggS family pyridoxal phosphate-dependent enzyme [Patescibacteria group bacterium]
MQLPSTKICLVTKGRTIPEIEKVLKAHPQIKAIAENRWPDCEEKFRYLAKKHPKLERHFIGQLQSNKVSKVVSLVDTIQSVDSLKLLKKINQSAKALKKTINFFFQVNISKDSAKSGIIAGQLRAILKEYKTANLANTKLLGLMTIGQRTSPEERKKYYRALSTLAQKHNLKEVSMGTSEDYQIAVEAGATMLRIGEALFGTK